MSLEIGFYSMTDTHDAATLLSIIGQQRKLIEMQLDHIRDLDRRLAVSIRERVELQEQIEEMRAEKPAVPYALTPKPPLSCDDCRYRPEHDYCRDCGPTKRNHKHMSYAIPREGCNCGACEAARGRGEAWLVVKKALLAAQQILARHGVDDGEVQL